MKIMPRRFRSALPFSPVRLRSQTALARRFTPKCLCVAASWLLVLTVTSLSAQEPSSELVSPIVVASPAGRSETASDDSGIIRVATLPDYLLAPSDDDSEVPLTAPQLIDPQELAAELAAEAQQTAPSEPVADEQADAQELVETEPAIEAGDDGLQLPELGAFLTGLARRHIPHTFSDNKKWGKTAERWDGLEFELDGLRLETRRRRKTVNHGNWQRYDVRLLDPNREFVIRLNRLETREDGRLLADVDISSYVQAHGRFARWNHGVQLISLGVDARARLNLNVVVSLGTELDFSQVPPAVVFDPIVESSRLSFQDFEVDRIGEIGGDVAEWLGDQCEGTIRARVEDQQEKITAKLNRAIDRNRDDLRLSVVELTQNEWGRLVERQIAAQQKQN